MAVSFTLPASHARCASEQYTGPGRPRFFLPERATTRLQQVGGRAFAETTSEKIAIGRFLDGRVSAVLGTHTHVQTADEQIFPGGTAFLCDAGMCGPNESILGRAIDPQVVQRALKLIERAKAMGVVS